MEVTGTYKFTKTDLSRQGYDPAATADVLYFNDPERRMHSFGSTRRCTTASRPERFASNMVLNEIRNVVETLQSDIAGGPIFPNVAPEEIRNYLASRYDFTRTLLLEDVVADVEQMLRNWQVQITHPRYFGLFNPSVTLASVIADALVAMYNPQFANWRTSPAANEIERHTLGWLVEKLGLPGETIAISPVAGRRPISLRCCCFNPRFPNTENMVCGATDGSPTVYVTREANPPSWNKIAHMTGLGRQMLRAVATDSDLKMNVEDLARAKWPRIARTGSLLSWWPEPPAQRRRARSIRCRS